MFLEVAILREVDLGRIKARGSMLESVTRDEILDEIRKTATANDGRPLGKSRFTEDPGSGLLRSTCP